MDGRIEQYCLIDPIFYDSPARANDQGLDFEYAVSPVPDGWERAQLEEWIVYTSKSHALPAQGWKVHVSACLDNASEVLSTVWDYCIPRQISFKFLRGRHVVLMNNAKYASRGSSGKFVTIYPADEAQFERVLIELGNALDGQAGPYILSDLRWGDGPLYVRYGGFAERHCLSPTGALVPAIEDPTARLVPDLREPAFEPPGWVTLPEFLRPHQEARNNTTIEDMPYLIDAVLHFSNGGGLYTGSDRRTGDRVVLKEARPYAGLSTDGSDAVTRLGRERTALERLAGLDEVPGVLDQFTVAGHQFLVLEFIEGEPLNTLVSERNPLTARTLDEEEAARYASWVVGVCGRVERALAAVHDRGVVAGDVHPHNILVRPDGRIVLIDFEAASGADEARRQILAAPGFAAPAGRSGLDVDRYAMACLRLFLFLPLTALIELDPGKARYLAAQIADLFPLPRGWLDEAVRTLNDLAAPPGRGGRGTAEPGRGGRETAEPAMTLTPDGAGWERVRASMTEAILAAATPERDDRLFPGDIEQFATGGLDVAYGAAGVLYALDVTGAGRHPALEEWLLRRAARPEPGMRPGFYDGLHGVAYVLDHLGHRSEALKLLDVCANELRGKWDRLGIDLQGGLAGIGLNLAHFAGLTAEPTMLAEALRVADVVADRLGGEADVPVVSGGDDPYAGLLRGSSGPALMFIRLYEKTGDAGLLDLAATALGQDLRRCVLRGDGSMEVDEGWRTMPYLAGGSVGVGLVVQEYLRHRHDARFAEAAAAIRRAAEALFYVEPQLFYGRAGMILYLSHGLRPGTAVRDPVVAAHIRRLNWHALTYRGHLAFPGDALLRLSMDLASGTAGVLLALGAALHGGPVHLPFLGAHPSPPTRPLMISTK
ncbi:MAG: class III lanthionine synthetase LanKC [Spirillospora sp.]